jgi:hypothetical protein
LQGESLIAVQVRVRRPINHWANTGRSTKWTVVLSMNQREQPSAPRGALAVPCLALLLLPIHALSIAAGGMALPPPMPVATVRPYLANVGAPPLRFSEPAPPLEPAPHLTLAAPPSAPLQGHESDPANDVTLQAVPAGETAATRSVEVATSDKPSDATAATRTPPSIIPDELRPRVRPEDFLPFFQIPAGTEMSTPLPRSASTPAQLPTSSATYTQTPR